MLLHYITALVTSFTADSCNELHLILDLIFVALSEFIFCFVCTVVTQDWTAKLHANSQPQGATVMGVSVAEWLAGQTQARKSMGSNRSRNAFE